MIDQGNWEKLANQAPAVPKAASELAWIESRIEQLESALDFELCEVIRIVGSAQLIAKLENQYQEDEKFRRRWRKTQFIFLPAYWQVDGDDNHWYSMGIQTNLNNFLNAHGLAYPDPMPVSHIETRWTLWSDGMSPADSEEAAKRLDY